MMTEIRQPLIEMFLNDSEENRASYCLPELVYRGHTDERKVRVMTGVEWRCNADVWQYQHVDSESQLFMSGRVQPVANGWQTTLTLENRSEETWKNVVAICCLSLAATRDYADHARTRTYLKSGGRICSLAESEYDGGKELFRMSLVDGAVQLERSERHCCKWGFTLSPSEDGVIAVSDPNGSHLLTVTWEQVHHLQANAQHGYACIHANPAFGDLAPGDRRTVKGTVLLTTEDIESAWSAALISVRESD